MQCGYFNPAQAKPNPTVSNFNFAVIDVNRTFLRQLHREAPKVLSPYLKEKP